MNPLIETFLLVLSPPSLRDNDWPTSLGSSNGKAYDTALVLGWLEEFLGNIDSETSCVFHLLVDFIFLRLLPPTTSMIFSQHCLLRNARAMICFKVWKLQWFHLTRFSAICGHVDCGLRNRTGQWCWPLQNPCVHLDIMVIVCYVSNINLHASVCVCSFLFGVMCGVVSGFCHCMWP